MKLPGYIYVMMIGFPALAQNNNCATATQVCNDISFSGNSGGAGVQELPNNNTIDGCLTIEHQSSWYYFQPVTSGTVSLTIQTSVDYDFAIWTGGCTNLGSPVRCSYASAAGNTGLAAINQGTPSGCGTLGLSPCPPFAVTDVSEGTGGDRYVMPLNVVAGQTYIMLVDNFTSNSTPFTLDWTFSNGATLNCNPVQLPVELSSFTGEYDASRNANLLQWSTVSENNNAYFDLSRSADGANWTPIDQQPGAGTSFTVRNYQFEDTKFESGRMNYYRLSQTDANGIERIFELVAVDNTASAKKVLRVTNALGQTVGPDTKGLVIILYEDGTVQQVFRP